MTWKDFLDPSWEAAIELGLRPKPTRFDEVSQEVIHRLAAQGAPAAPQHWSRGRDTLRHRSEWERRRGQIYEIVFDMGSYAMAYISTAQGQATATLTVPHVLGHSHVFAVNAHQLRHPGDVYAALEAGTARVAQYEARYGPERVAQLITVAIALSDLVEPDEPPSPPPSEPPQENPYAPVPDWESYAPPRERQRQDAVAQHRHARGEGEKDILRYIIRYAPILEDWERDVLEVERTLALSHKRSGITKFLHEGFASWTHSRILHRLAPRLPKDWLGAIARAHSNVLRPSLQNPYWLGYEAIRYLEEKESREAMLKHVERLTDASLFALLTTAPYWPGFGAHLLREAEAEDLTTTERTTVLEEMRGYLVSFAQALLQRPPHIEVAAEVPNASKLLVTVTGQAGLPPLRLLARDPVDLTYAKRVMEEVQKVWGGTVWLYGHKEAGEVEG
jgi:stage V sporulation protein R